MKDKDAQLIYEAYTDRPSGVRYPHGDQNPNPKTIDKLPSEPSPRERKIVGSLDRGYQDLGSAVMQDQLEDIIDELKHVEPYHSDTIEYTDDFKQSLKQLLRHTASSAERVRDPRDHKEVDERTVAAELDNYISWLFHVGDKQPYKAIKRYLDSEYGPFDEEEYEEEDPRPDIYRDHY